MRRTGRGNVPGLRLTALALAASLVGSVSLPAFAAQLPAGPPEARSSGTPDADGAQAPADAVTADDLTTADDGARGPAPYAAGIPAADRDRLLTAGWKTSDDLAWTTIGDATGFHLLTATAGSGYDWDVVATLVEPGAAPGQWIGNACVTSSGRYAVAVYAPRVFTNDESTFGRGGFTAVVDLSSGDVTKLAVSGSLAYFDPGCGADDKAVITTARTDDDLGDTRLVVVDATDASTTTPVEVPGQVTSAVPAGGDAIVAAMGRYLVRVDPDGTVAPVAQTRGTPFDLAVDQDGGVVFMDRHLPAELEDAGAKELAARTHDVDAAGYQEDDAVVLRVPRAQWASAAPLAGGVASARVRGTLPAATELARGAWGAFSVAPGAEGRVHLVGTADVTARGTDSVRLVPEAAPRSEASTTGAVFVRSTAWADDAPVTTTADARDARVELVLPRRGDVVTFAVPVDEETVERVIAAEPSPVLRGGAVTGADPAGESGAESGGDRAADSAADSGADADAAGHSTAAVSASLVTDALPEGAAERTCAVPRNDPSLQAMQPKPRQIEWAVDQAIYNNLDTWISRPAGWKNLDVAAYRPQALNPPHDLVVHGENDPIGTPHVPAQIMLGIAAQESNLWQAARFALPGVTANPLIGNYYGIDYYDGDGSNDWDIDFREADCGYGVTQVTDGMRLSDTGRSANEKKAIAVDYTANIAAGLRILTEKWNQTASAGMKINDGDWSRPENWFYATWAYNSGFYPQGADGNTEPWGVGWFNNPANLTWDPLRTPFLDGNSYDDAAHPQDWPYPEKVLGWAAWPIESWESPGVSLPGYRAAWWVSNEARSDIKPPLGLFCDETNECDPDAIPATPGNPDHLQPCTRDDFRCWFHGDAEWKGDCVVSCGNELVRFNQEDYDEEDDGTSYPPHCDRDDVTSQQVLFVDETQSAPARPGCDRVDTGGSFTWSFTEEEALEDGRPRYPSKIDLHQLGAGFNGRFVFGHTRSEQPFADRMKTCGTWSTGAPGTGWYRLAVHLPDHGAHTQQARYEIDTGSGSFTRVRYVNQHRRENAWVSLGTYEISGTPRIRLCNLSEDGNGTHDVAWDAAAFQNVGSQKPKQIAVLGATNGPVSDTGTDYFPETDSDTTGRENHCRRSRDPQDWPFRLDVPGASSGTLSGTPWSSDVELAVQTCADSRAQDLWRVDDLWNPGSAYAGEIAPTRSGVLSRDTDYVFLTLGWSELVPQGGSYIESMVDGCYRFDTALCSQDLLDADLTVDPDVLFAITGIHRQAPHAKIIVASYPDFFPDTDAPGIEECAYAPGGDTWYLLPAEAARVKDASDRLKEAVELAVSRSQLLVDTRVELAKMPDFGQHHSCGAADPGRCSRGSPAATRRSA